MALWTRSEIEAGYPGAVSLMGTGSAVVWQCVRHGVTVVIMRRADGFYTVRQ